MHASLLAKTQNTTINRPRGLELNYAPEMPLAILQQLETAARVYGLPLGELELLGQCPEHAAKFVDAVIHREAPAFLQTVNWHALEHKLYNGTKN